MHDVVPQKIVRSAPLKKQEKTRKNNSGFILFYFVLLLSLQPNCKRLLDEIQDVEGWYFLVDVIQRPRKVSRPLTISNS